MSNLATVPKPTQPVVDPATGLVDRDWWRFFHDPLFGSLNIAGGVSGGLLAFITDTEVVSSALLAKNGLILGGGAGATPFSLNPGAAAQILLQQALSAAPAWKTLSGDGSITAAGALTVGSVTGTATNDNAAAGKVGEYIVSTIASGGAIGLTSGVTANVTSISLTAGDWDVGGVIDFTFNAATSYTNLSGGSSSTSATLGAQDSFFDFETPAAVPTSAKDMAWVIPTVRYSLAATTTIYLVAQATFTVNTLAAYGTIRARRVR